MGLRDALYALERAGLEVSANGYGRVIEQSVPPGSRVENKNISIRLDI